MKTRIAKDHANIFLLINEEQMMVFPKTKHGLKEAKRYEKLWRKGELKSVRKHKVN